MADGRRKERPLGTGEKWMLILAEPLMLGVFALLPFVLAFVLSDGRFDRMPDAVASIAEWTEPVLTRFFDAAALVGAVLVTLAAATAFGLARRGEFSRRTQIRILLAAAAGVLLIALMAALAVPVAVVDPQRWAEVGMVLAVAWVILLGAQMIQFVVTPRERSRTAKRVWRERRDRAVEQGIALAEDASEPRMRMVCEVAAWVVPTVIWAAVALFVTRAFALGGDFGDAVLLLGLVAFYGNFAIIAGWRVTADLSMSSTSRMAVRVAMMSFGALASGALAVALIVTGTYAILGLALLVFTSLHMLFYLVPSWRRRLPWVSTTEEAATRSAVAGLRRTYEEAKALAS